MLALLTIQILEIVSLNNSHKKASTKADFY